MTNIDEIRAELKQELMDLQKAEQETDVLDQAWDENPEDEELEKAFEESYKKEEEIFCRCVGLIVKMTGIKRSTAATMLRTKRAQIIAII